ncbi:MAG: helix-turn-helix transcriptional regulator [Pseudomonadota bacterium]
MPKGDYLGEFEQLVLLALLRLGDTAYGVTIRRELSERAERDVSFGTVYSTLDRLEEKGFISSRMGEPTAERGGRAKKYFKIEAAGEHALRRSRETADRMWAGLPIPGTA